MGREGRSARRSADHFYIGAADTTGGRRYDSQRATSRVEAGTAAGETPRAGWIRRGGVGQCSLRAGSGEVVAERRGQRATSGEEDWARRGRSGSDKVEAGQLRRPRKVERERMCGSHYVLVGMKERYSLRFGKRSRLGQRHGLQNTTLTCLFYKNIY
jgi:hypothetical protein